MCFFVPAKGHPYPAFAMTGIVTPFKNLAKFGIIASGLISDAQFPVFYWQKI
jgi:hypothetical protein